MITSSGRPRSGAAVDMHSARPSAAATPKTMPQPAAAGVPIRQLEPSGLMLPPPVPRAPWNPEVDGFAGRIDGERVGPELDSLRERYFLLTDRAGTLHRHLSRHTMRQKISLLQGHLAAHPDAPAASRAHWQGEVSYLKVRLGAQTAAAVLTRPLDGLLGTYKVDGDNPEDDINLENLRCMGAVGLLALAIGNVAGMRSRRVKKVTLTVAGGVAQAASLLGAGVKGLVAVAAHGPAKLAARQAMRRVQ